MNEADNPNKHIYNTKYTADNVALFKKNISSYDREMINIRLKLLRKYGMGKEVLDLCCGTGSYLAHEWGIFKRVTGVDFSKNYLNILKERFGDQLPNNLRLLESDVRQIEVESESMDFVFSYTSLYHVPQVWMAISEVGRVLRKGGIAIFELGNLWSLNTLVCRAYYDKEGIAKPFHIPYLDMGKYIKNAGLTTLEEKSFQVLPLWGSRPRWLLPVLIQPWKQLLSLKIGERMLDEIISSRYPFRLFAFRHLFICRK